MKQYQRNSESEFERFLINEDYQEQTEYQEDLEELKTEFWHGLVAKFKEDNNWTKFLSASDIEYDKRVVEKVERVTEEMRRAYWDDFDDVNWDDSYEEYFPEDSDFDDLIEDANYRDGEGMI